LDLSWQNKIIGLIVLFVFSAFFSGSEVALFSLDRRKILLQENGRSSLAIRYILILLEHPRRLLVTILIGNTVINVAASIVAVSLALEFASSYNVSEDLVLSIQIILLTIIVILFGELTPKVWASKNPLQFSRIISIPLYWTQVILYPIAETLTEGIKLFISKIKVNRGRSAMSPEELSELAAISREKGTLVEEEHGLIQSIVNFKSVTVSEVMTPRVDMITTSFDSSFAEVVRTIVSSGHSRIPVYKESLDEITGILYAKDLLPHIKNSEKQRELNLEKLARRAMFVPRSKRISELMEEFQERKMHLAIVVDEYGGTAGLVSLEDIIEEIVGEIRDEYDKEELPYSLAGENKYLVVGKLSIDEVKELLDMDLRDNGDEEEYETLAGFVLNKAGHIPKEGYSFIFNDWKFTVKEVTNKRIKKVLIEKGEVE
jgi:putative hemolysin